MTTVYVFRLLYLGLVAFGLYYCTLEYLRCRWLTRELVRTNTNGIRQLIAGYFKRDALICAVVQFCLLIPSLAGFAVHRAVTRGVAPRGEMEPWNLAWMSAALLAHIVAVALLSHRAWSNNRGRRDLMSAANAELTRRRTVPTPPFTAV